jgi:NAD(P)-dependent dehydrogenase (short-subunit alcohol dehydrogenase family)
MGKTIVVTGGSSGIGLAAVRRLVADGHRVYSASRDPERTELPPGATPLVCDVGDLNCAATLDAVVAETGGIDALVNNAGIGEIAAFEDSTDDAGRRILEVNLLGPMRLAQAAVPLLRERGGGNIVNVTSLNDVYSPPFGGWYSASKAGLAAASYSLAAEVKQFGIHVTVVSPGLFATEMVDQLATFGWPDASPYARVLEAMKAMQAERITTAGDPDEVGAAIAAVIADDEPPVRVVVGADAQALAATGLDPNVYVPTSAAMVRAGNAPV